MSAVRGMSDLAPQAWIARLPQPITGPATGPLAGMRFAVNDNIDASGMSPTAACPAFSYAPAAHAAVVQKLLDAGACLLGKTNLDQFACGLNGAVPSAFNAAYVSGGSSVGWTAQSALLLQALTASPQ